MAIEIVAGQVDQLVLDLGRLSVQSDLVEEIADLAPRPDRGDEVVIGRHLGEFRLERLREEAVSRMPLECERGGAVAFVSADHLELLALEEVGEPRRIHLDETRPAADFQLEVGPHRALDLGRERRHFHFQVLGRAHVSAATARRFRQQVEQVGIDVVADPERVDADSIAVAPIDDLEDLRRLGQADRRQAVGQEDDLEGSSGSLFRPKTERGLERGGDVGSPGRFEVLDPGAGLAQILERSLPTGSWRNDIGVVANAINAKRSSGPSESRVCFKAALACRSFSSSMLDDVSTTSTRSRGDGSVLGHGRWG